MKNLIKVSLLAIILGISISGIATLPTNQPNPLYNVSPESVIPPPPWAV